VEKLTQRKHYRTQEIAQKIKQSCAATWLQTMATKTYMNQSRETWNIHTTEQESIQKQDQFREQQRNKIRNQLED